MSQMKFNTVVDSLGPRLLNFATKQLGSVDIAKDLVQDSFLVYLEKQKMVLDGKEKSFLFRVLSNKILDHYKLKKNNVDYTKVHLRTSDGSAQRDSKEIINLALLRLKPEQKQLITLRDLEGYNYEEIADIMNLSLGKVKVYLFRARKKLKEEVIRLDIGYECFNK